MNRMDAVGSVSCLWSNSPLQGARSKDGSSSSFDALIQQAEGTSSAEKVGFSANVPSSSAPSEQGQSFLSSLDKDIDGVLSASEMGVSRDVFSKLDTNGDGGVDGYELDAGRSDTSVMQSMMQSDGDGSSPGSISLEDIGRIGRGLLGDGAYGFVASAYSSILNLNHTQSTTSGVSLTA